MVQVQSHLEKEQDHTVPIGKLQAYEMYGGHLCLLSWGSGGGQSQQGQYDIQSSGTRASQYCQEEFGEAYRENAESDPSSGAEQQVDW
jgi:hypothetical protein